MCAQKLLLQTHRNPMKTYSEYNHLWNHEINRFVVCLFLLFWFVLHFYKRSISVLNTCFFFFFFQIDLKLNLLLTKSLWRIAGRQRTKQRQESIQTNFPKRYLCVCQKKLLHEQITSENNNQTAHTKSTKTIEMMDIVMIDWIQLGSARTKTAFGAMKYRKERERERELLLLLRRKKDREKQRKGRARDNDKTRERGRGEEGKRAR